MLTFHLFLLLLRRVIRKTLAPWLRLTRKYEFIFLLILLTLLPFLFFLTLLVPLTLLILLILLILLNLLILLTLLQTHGGEHAKEG